MVEDKEAPAPMKNVNEADYVDNDKAERAALEKQRRHSERRGCDDTAAQGGRGAPGHHRLGAGVRSIPEGARHSPREEGGH
jgi:hypothetical protein